ncbi:MAG: hypothetical protein H7Y43_03530 [Akkermansiaceae bacterium]|nr:hypothetical protein [Verrucomicrobiales bacterium]
MEIARPFDLVEGPLLRVKLIRIADNEHLLVLTCHQIVTDAWSLGLFARELAELYSNFTAGQSSPLPALSTQYADYAVWQQRWLADAAVEKQLAFWKEQLTGWPTLALTNPPNPSSNRSAVKSVILEKSLLQKLRAFNASESVTTYMTLLTVYKLVIAAWKNTADVVVGSPESGRRRSETETLLGCFVNMLPLRTRLRPEDTFRSLLNRVRETTAQAFANADVPFENIQATLRRHDATRSRLFQVWFGPIDALQPFVMGGVQVALQPVFPPEAQFDLSCFVSENADSIRLFFEFKEETLNSAQLDEMLRQFRRVLTEACDHPEMPLGKFLQPLNASRPEPAPAAPAQTLTLANHTVRN